MKNVIQTIGENCQDCYRCVRACPVKAIMISDAQAHIVDDLCIHCGTCVRVCPKEAKTSVSELTEVISMLAREETVIASIAPSFAALFSDWKTKRLPSALRLLGFTHVSETAEGAEQVSIKSMENKQETTICTACPVVVNYIEKYQPEYLEKMIPVTSPMVLHGRMLKNRYPGAKVVFIGPCAGKKQEALRPENLDSIDAVLTFEELIEWMGQENIRLEDCPESGFESYGDLKNARMFPVQGGMLRTCGISADSTETEILHISGADNLKSLFEIPSKYWGYQMVEPMFCPEGCINGPCFSHDNEESVYQRKRHVLEYAAQAETIPDAPVAPLDFQASFRPQPPEEDIEITEDAIQKVYERTGKTNPELRLNCGACGYDSCRDKAIAVIKGLAEPEMCIPYMRRIAQQKTDKIIEMSPNGVVVLDKDLNIIHMNRAFQKLFLCNNEVLGRRISYLVDSEGFDKIAAGESDRRESIKTKYGKKYHEVLYVVPDEKQYVGVYTDISQIKFDASQLDIIKRQTLQQAKELLDHQIRFSQEMAHYLGNSTAQNEEMVKKLIDLYDDGTTEQGEDQ